MRASGVTLFVFFVIGMTAGRIIEDKKHNHPAPEAQVAPVGSWY